MKITITINCDNAAFDDDPTEEIFSILHGARANIERLATGTALERAYPLLDANGNRVGDVRWNHKRRPKRNRHPPGYYPPK